MLSSISGADSVCPRLASGFLLVEFSDALQVTCHVLTCRLLCFALNITALIANSPMLCRTETVHVLRYVRVEGRSYDTFSGMPFSRFRADQT